MKDRFLVTLRELVFVISTFLVVFSLRREARSLFMVGEKKIAEKILKQILQVDPEHQLSLTLLPKLQ